MATRKNHKSYTPQQRCITVIPQTTEKSAICMLYGKYLRCARQKSAVTPPFILHSPFTYHWEARSHHSSVPLPVLLVSLHWRKLSPHIPITVHCGIQTYHTA
ncbi:hypothetical protein TcCL_NonESM12187 [Trypanosoma cruzi]|nr:hypothetical protein TcCL_NonESM12187 [Trypanosoma cruzi]